MTALSARCYVTQWAVENLSVLQGIVWNLKQRRIKSYDEIKCYFILNRIKKIYSPCLVSVVHLTYFVVFGVF